MATKRTKPSRTAVWVKRRRPAAKKITRVRSSDAGDITPKPMLIGYARVSTVDQNLALQRDALTDAGCQKIFTEQMSGAVADRHRRQHRPCCARAFDNGAAVPETRIAA